MRIRTTQIVKKYNIPEFVTLHDRVVKTRTGYSAYYYNSKVFVLTSQCIKLNRYLFTHRNKEQYYNVWSTNEYDAIEEARRVGYSWGYWGDPKLIIE